MNCKNCSNPIPEGAKFCGKCGQKVIVETKSFSLDKRKKSVFKTVISIIGFILAIYIGLKLISFTIETVSPISTDQTSQSETYSSTDYKNQFVTALKTKMLLPNKVGESTTLVDITAEPTAIRFYFVISGIDTSNLTNEKLKNSFVSGICESKDTKTLFDKGINMEYSYTVKDSTQSYFVVFTKSDCS